jgi:hypothetical protein
MLTLQLMKTKVIQRKFEDQDSEDTRTMPDEDAAADAAADAVIPATQPNGGAAAAASRVKPHWPPALPIVLPPALGARAHRLQARGLQGVVGRMLGPNADAD